MLFSFNLILICPFDFFFSSLTFNEFPFDKLLLHKILELNEYIPAPLFDISFIFFNVFVVFLVLYKDIFDVSLYNKLYKIFLLLVHLVVNGEFIFLKDDGGFKKLFSFTIFIFPETF